MSEDARPAVWWRGECGDCAKAWSHRYFNLPDGWYSAHHGPGARRRKRNSLRAWRHEQKIRIRKGQDFENYDREWLD